MDLEKLFYLKPDDTLSLKELLSLLKPTQEIEHRLLNLHLVGILSGNESQFFKNDNGYLYPKEGISLKNETEACSKSVLCNYSKLGNQVSFLLDSIEKCLKYEDEQALTRISYCLTLRDIINECVLKKLLENQATSSRAVNYFSDYLEDQASGYLLIKLNVLHEIGVALSGGNDSAGKILNILMDFIYLDRVHEFNVVSQLLLSSLRPSLDYIESLLTNGVIKDDRAEFFFTTKSECDPDYFWTNCLKFNERNAIPSVFSSSWELICMGIKSRMLIDVLTQRNSPNQLEYPRRCLFEHFLHHLRQAYDLDSTLAANTIGTSQDSLGQSRMKLRLEKYEEILSLNYKLLNLEDQLEVDIENPNFSSIEKFSPEPFLPNDYTCHGISFELALKRSLSLALKTFIKPMNDWLLNHAKNSYHTNLFVFNDYFLLQRSNPEMRLYFEALFTDITEGCDRNETCHLNWRYYSFMEHNVTAFLSDQRLTNQKMETNFTILENIHLIYEEMDWTSRVIIDNNSKRIYDKAFRFLLHITYCRWILDNLKLPRARAKRDSQRNHQMCLTRYRMLHIANNLYNFIMNNIHEQVIHLYKNFSIASDYEQLRGTFHNFIGKIGTITMQGGDNNSKIVRTLIRKFCHLVNDVGKIWWGRNGMVLPLKSDIDNFEKSFKIYLFNANSLGDQVPLKH